MRDPLKEKLRFPVQATGQVPRDGAFARETIKRKYERTEPALNETEQMKRSGLEGRCPRERARHKIESDGGALMGAAQRGLRAVCKTAEDE